MSYVELIILGFIVNVILYIFIIVVGVILGIVSLAFIGPDEIFRIQKMQVEMQELKSRMKPEHFRAEQMEFFGALLIPYAMIYKFGVLLTNLAKADFNLVNVSYMKMQKMKDKYGL